MVTPSIDLLKKAARALYDKKGMNIRAIDVREAATMTDYVLIAEGSVDRHVVALAQEVIAILKEEGLRPVHEDGLHSGEWVAVDYVHFMVHVLKPDLRHHYQLEQVWKESKPLDLDLDQ